MTLERARVKTVASTFQMSCCVFVYSVIVCFPFTEYNCRALSCRCSESERRYRFAWFVLFAWRQCNGDRIVADSIIVLLTRFVRFAHHHSAAENENS